jgi:NAD(P)H dehydrogenase (quinone)
MKQFLDSAGPRWAQGKLANKAVAGFTGAGNVHGGQESTLLALYNTMYHWCVAIIPAGYTDSVIFGAGGNPYGVSIFRRHQMARSLLKRSRPPAIWAPA